MQNTKALFPQGNTPAPKPALSRKSKYSLTQFRLLRSHCRRYGRKYCHLLTANPELSVKFCQQRSESTPYLLRSSLSLSSREMPRIDEQAACTVAQDPAVISACMSEPAIPGAKMIKLLGKGGSKRCYMVRFTDGEKALLTYSGDTAMPFKYQNMLGEPTSMSCLRELGLDVNPQYELVMSMHKGLLAPAIMAEPFEKLGGIVFDMKGMANDPPDNCFNNKTVNLGGRPVVIGNIDNGSDYRAAIDSLCRDMAILIKRGISLADDSINLHLTAGGVLRIFPFDLAGMDDNGEQCIDQLDDRIINIGARQAANAFAFSIHPEGLCSDYLKSLDDTAVIVPMFEDGIRKHLKLMSVG